MLFACPVSIFKREFILFYPVIRQENFWTFQTILAFGIIIGIGLINHINISKCEPIGVQCYKLSNYFQSFAKFYSFLELRTFGAVRRQQPPIGRKTAFFHTRDCKRPLLGLSRLDCWTDGQ